MIFSSKLNSKFHLIAKNLAANLESDKKEGGRNGILLVDKL